MATKYSTGSKSAAACERGSARARRRRTRPTRGTLLIAAALAMVLDTAPAPAEADGFFEFTELSEPQLFELFTAVGDELIARGALKDLSAATDAYAGWLVTNALGLTPLEQPEVKGYFASGPGGGGYRIIGLRLRDVDAAAPLPNDTASADIVAVVLFTPDNQVGRAGLIPQAVYSEAAAAGAGVTVSDPIWRRDGVTDITPQLFRTVVGQQ